MEKSVFESWATCLKLLDAKVCIVLQGHMPHSLTLHAHIKTSLLENNVFQSWATCLELLDAKVCIVFQGHMPRSLTLHTGLLKKSVSGRRATNLNLLQKSSLMSHVAYLAIQARVEVHMK
jgi:hypothetical protein